MNHDQSMSISLQNNLSIACELHICFRNTGYRVVFRWSGEGFCGSLVHGFIFCLERVRMFYFSINSTFSDTQICIIFCRTHMVPKAIAPTVCEWPINHHWRPVNSICDMGGMVCKS